MIIGHEKQKKVLHNFLEKNNTPHALLFCGPEKVGKRSLALEFIKLVNSIEGDIEKGNHPDILLITPEKEEIYIEQIEQVIQKVSLKSSILPFKGVVIDDAHLMNDYAQNSLLKTLEEPSGDTIIFLITEYPFLLLPTITSRTFKLNFTFVDEKEIYQLLQKEGCKESKEISSLAMGRPGVALEYSSFKEKKEEEVIRRKEFADIINNDLTFRFQRAKEISKKDDLKGVMKCWLQCLRSEFLEKVKNKEDIKKIKEVIEEIEDAILITRKTNVNIQLLLEKIMIKL